MCDFCETIYDEEEYFEKDSYVRFYEEMDGLVKSKNGMIYYYHNEDDPYYGFQLPGFRYCPICGRRLIDANN